MGTVVDRSEEHLGVTDVGIIQMRRRLITAATELEEEGVEPYAATHGDVYHLHAGDAVLPANVASWAEDAKTREVLTPKW